MTRKSPGRKIAVRRFSKFPRSLSLGALSRNSSMRTDFQQPSIEKRLEVLLSISKRTIKYLLHFGTPFGVIFCKGLSD